MFRFLAPSAVVLAVVFVSAPAAAHKPFEVDAALGYRFGGALDVDSGGTEGRVTLDGAPAFTGIFGYRIQPNGFIFINYSRQSTTARYRSDDLATTGQTGLSTEYLQFGGNLEVTRGRWVPYLGFSIGATRLAATDMGGDEWRFSAVVDGGVKFDITEWLHLRLLGRLPFTFVSGESEVFCVVPGGCLVTLDGTPLIQGEVYGGVGLSF